MSTSPESTVLRGQRAQGALRARVDTELRTSRYLQGAKADPRLFDPDLERAFDEVSELARTAARTEGFADGYASGRTQATLDVRKELEAELAALREADARREASSSALLILLGRIVTELEARVVPTYEEVADHLGPAVYALVETILGRELILSPDLALDAVRRACTAAPRGSNVTVWVNPSDAQMLQQIDLESALGRRVNILIDWSLDHGDALAESGATRVDARLATALARVREMLEG